MDLSTTAPDEDMARGRTLRGRVAGSTRSPDGAVSRGAMAAGAAVALGAAIARITR